MTTKSAKFSSSLLRKWISEFDDGIYTTPGFSKMVDIATVLTEGNPEEEIVLNDCSNEVCPHDFGRCRKFFLSKF